MNFGAEWARRNLDDDIGSKATSSGMQPASAQYGGASAPSPFAVATGYGAPAAGSRGGSEQLVTITVLSMREKGLQREEMQQWFTAQPGFIAMQVNERIDGMFVKYSTQQQAQQVMNDGNQRFGFGAEWARRNLDDDRSTGSQPPSFHSFAGPAVGVAPQVN